MQSSAAPYTDTGSCVWARSHATPRCATCQGSDGSQAPVFQSLSLVLKLITEPHLATLLHKPLQTKEYLRFLQEPNLPGTMTDHLWSWTSEIIVTVKNSHILITTQYSLFSLLYLKFFMKIYLFLLKI